MLLSFVLVTIIVMLVTRSIRQPLQETVDAMQRVANCDLTVQMKDNRHTAPNLIIYKRRP